jgi:hypothetical protein
VRTKILLMNIASWNTLHFEADANSDALLKQLVLTAILPDAARRLLPPKHSHWRTPGRPVLHHEIRPTPNFSGRNRAMLEIAAAFAPSGTGTAALTQSTSISGLGGIGKSTPAREYAPRKCWMAARPLVILRQTRPHS